MRTWQLGDAFVEGMSLLQRYPIEAAGGIDVVIKNASELSRRRDQESRTRKAETLGLGARLKVTLWKGLAPQASPESLGAEDETEEESSGGGSRTNETETEPGITSRLASTVWRGITNQSSMEVPPSPLVLSPSPNSASPVLGTMDTRQDYQIGPSASGSSIWAYAEKLKDSDTVANLAKASTNFRAKAMVGAWGIRGGGASKPPPISPPTSDTPLKPTRSESPNAIDHTIRPTNNKSGAYSPPPRPTYFRPPRDSKIVQHGSYPMPPSPPGSPKISVQPEGGLLGKTHYLHASLASLTGLQGPPPPEKPKSAPRPLLLGSSSPASSPRGPSPVLRDSTPPPFQGQWTDVLRTKGHTAHFPSQSSISSLSPSDVFIRHYPNRSGSLADWESDGSRRSSPVDGRVVPLNRSSISPMAPRSRVHRDRGASISSSGTNSDSAVLSSGQGVVSVSRSAATFGTSTSKAIGRQGIAAPQAQGQLVTENRSSSPLTSPPIPATPLVTSHENDVVQVKDTEPQRGSVVLSDTTTEPLESLYASQSKIVPRRKTPPRAQTEDTYDSVRSSLSRSRLRPKRRPSHLALAERSSSQGTIAVTAPFIPEQITHNPNSLAVPWPEDETGATPKAAEFEIENSSWSSSGTTAPVLTRSQRRLRKNSGDEQEGRLRKVSNDGNEVRQRKESAEGHLGRRRERDSAAEEGDDEGYDDLLSAYESEEGQKSFSFAQALAASETQRR
jgi:hypothetical protein